MVEGAVVGRWRGGGVDGWAGISKPQTDVYQKRYLPSLGTYLDGTSFFFSFFLFFFFSSFNPPLGS